MFARKKSARNGRARSMRSTLRILQRTAHLVEPRPDGAWLRHSRRMGAQLLPVYPRFVPLRNKLSTQRDLDVRVSTRRTKEKFTAALVPNVEAWAVTVSLGTRDARDAGFSLVGRQHECVRRRMTGQCPKAGQGLVAQSTDSHSGTDIEVRVTSPFCFLEREAEHRKRHANAMMVNLSANRKCGMVNVISVKRLNIFMRRST